MELTAVKLFYFCKYFCLCLIYVSFGIDSVLQSVVIRVLGLQIALLKFNEAVIYIMFFLQVLVICRLFHVCILAGLIFSIKCIKKIQNSNCYFFSCRNTLLAEGFNRSIKIKEEEMFRSCQADCFPTIPPNYNNVMAEEIVGGVKNRISRNDTSFSK